MTSKRQKNLETNTPSLFSFTLAELREYFSSNSLSKFSADQIFGWCYKKYMFEVDCWSNVSNKTKAHIEQYLDNHIPEVVWVGLSKDGTRKFIVKMKDGETVESVIIPSKDRLTMCISSQVGCAIGCTFCYTGTMGFKRHLGSHEIIGQYLALSKWLIDNIDQNLRISNIVYMGQGEPLHNFDNVKKATEIFMESKGAALGQRKITLSTSGLVPQIEKLASFPPVNIAISLHASNDDIRDELMPINKRYDLQRLFQAIDKIPLKAFRRITYEYLLIKDFNDGQSDIKGLCRLLNKSKSKINLIPFNEYPDSKFKRPKEDKILWFRDQLIKAGYVCTIRQSKGNDILAACGQLNGTWSEPNKNK
ncbi:MAG: 23S rRNA (adenine(2503)-C(2))-methyltransferase RlmN [Bacteriovoracaceae bacterium]|nr:23S rRNA (adenine(2503)-C(2))-methyltransferase RlmN [Bacteriovoracaceae bacterium]